MRLCRPAYGGVLQGHAIVIHFVHNICYDDLKVSPRLDSARLISCKPFCPSPSIESKSSSRLRTSPPTVRIDTLYKASSTLCGSLSSVMRVFKTSESRAGFSSRPPSLDLEAREPVSSPVSSSLKPTTAFSW